MLVREVMTRSVVTAEPSLTLHEIAVRMRERNVGSIVLVEGGRAVGFITDRDIALSVVAEAATRRAASATTPRRP